MSGPSWVPHACLRVLYNVNLPQAHTTGMASLAVLGHLALLIIFLNYHVLTEASDPDPVGDYASDAKSFVIRDIFTNGEILHDTGGIRAAVTTDNFPAITAQGITYVRVRVVPCGCTLAHTHPRASEIMTLISGGPLQVGLIDTQGNAYVEILYPGDVTLFPRGMLHFELNVGNEIADYLAALNSQNPGTLTSASALFKIPKRALASSLNLPWNLLVSINSTISQSVGPSLQRVSRSGCVPGQDITIDI